MSINFYSCTLNDGRMSFCFKEEGSESVISSIAQIQLDYKSDCLFSYIKEFIYTLFDWKYIKIANTSTLININSVVKKTGISANEVRKLAREGTLEAKCCALFKAQILMKKYPQLNDKSKKLFENRKNESCSFCYKDSRIHVADDNGTITLLRPNGLAVGHLFKDVFIYEANEKYFIDLKQVKISLVKDGAIIDASSNTEPVADSKKILDEVTNLLINPS